VKLLFDNNLSPRLVAELSDVYPGSAHVQQFGLAETADTELLDFALKQDFILVSKDSDFFDPRLIRGRVTKIVWLRRGNCSTQDIEAILRRHVADVEKLETTDRLSLLMLY
jgi:predicted nuclease of predicted toxin-antitoxin system